MTRLIAILLFAAFLLPFAVPALALGQQGDAGLPACCRRNGAHHCSMAMAKREQATTADAKTPHWGAPLERCPYCSASVSSFHSNSFVESAAQAHLVAWFSHASGTVQTESRRRISRDRSRQKRGPPKVSRA